MEMQIQMQILASTDANEWIIPLHSFKNPEKFLEIKRELLDNEQCKWILLKKNPQ